MQFIIDSSYDDSTLRSLDRGLRFLLSVRKGTYPMDRNFGLSGAAIDENGPVAINLLAAELPDVLEAYEPRVVLDHVASTYDAKTGRAEPVIYFKEAESE